MSKQNINQLLQSAQDAGTLGTDAGVLLSGDLGEVVVAGAAGMDVDDIEASEVTLVTLMVDASSSISFRGLEEAVRDGQNAALDAISGSRQRDEVLTALWLFNDETKVMHAHIPVPDAERLSSSNYSGTGATRLFDTWCDALLANVAYAERLRASGTPVRSIAVVVTDGEDTCSRRSARDCARLSRDLLASEQFVLGFVGVGEDADFHSVAVEMGIPEGAIEVQSDATPSGLRKAFQLVSRSVIRASQGLVGAGGFFRP